MKHILQNKWFIALLVLVAAYIGYFSYFTILRYETLYASYFDLGIMHQTVYNTYRAIADGDPSRFLELTNPYGVEQIKRMAIHNDILLALLAPFYFIYAGPETLLVIQSVVLGLGALAVFLIAGHVFQKQPYRDPLAFVFSLSYLLYPAMERANMFDFHAVTLTTSLILFMAYFTMIKRYALSFFLFILCILSKEQVPLVMMFAAVFLIYGNWRRNKIHPFNYKKNLFEYLVLGVSFVWFVLSMTVIIPYFRGGHHFALDYYGDFGDSPFKIIIGIFQNPVSLAKYLWHIDTARYFLFLLGPVGFLSIFAPLNLAVAAPEFGVNLLSNSWNMRNIIYHYTSVIQPFVFVASIFGTRNLILFFERNGVESRSYAENTSKSSRLRSNSKLPTLIMIYMVGMTLIFAYMKGPLPFAREQEVHPFRWPQIEHMLLPEWKERLKDDSIKVMTTGQIAPHFTSRRYHYTFSPQYYVADYLVIRPGEIYNYPDNEVLIPAYEKLIHDPQFMLVYKKEGLEVYKKN